MTPNANVSDRGDQINGFLHPKAKKTTLDHPSKLECLANEIQIAKAEKHALDNKIKELEAEVVSICGYRSEGISKFSSESFKISTTGKINRKITDPESLIALAPDLVVTKYTLDMKEFNNLGKSNPTHMQRVLQCIESKEAKTAVVITPSDKG